MSASPEQICSLAMVHLGQNPIADLADTSNANAVKCNAVYPVQRDALLREFDWSFARKRTTLEQDATAPEFGYQYRYKFPDDLLAIRSFNSAIDATQGDSGSGYSTKYQREGNYILTDDDTAYLVYTRAVVETGLFDALFVELLAVKIARTLATPILKDRGMKAVQFMDALYKELRSTAKRVCVSESDPKRTDDADRASWLTARGSSSSSGSDG